MSIVAIHIGSVLLHREESRSRPVHLQACGRANQASRPDRTVILTDAGSRSDAVVLPTARRLDLGVGIVDVGADVLGHVLGGGALANKGVHDGGEGADRVVCILVGLDEVCGGGISRKSLNNLCRMGGWG